ncbi:dienelactone hydrolase family protein [Mycolicibacterium sp. 050158]|uniref:dienelactone hydrolase family protein n=1 Tax=Mycolicibacterium sp. 050158 TaxID=3090602 RepID=UPI00299D9F1A|nr:dienelactone hydrolase family protein [Mycolicibacterium sp. 050158]MDX1890578.1 dienelactone hydrolase family protein [Mycolicibacterium sp. 050158]
MPTITDTITTPDGTCPVTLAVPDGDGPWPGIVLFPDAAGRRPVMEQMAQRLADLGYAVLVPDVYYREGDWAPFDIDTAFGDPDERTRLMSMMGSLTPDRIAADAGAFFDYLQARPEVRGTTFGTTGYCMGGRASLLVAGRVPERVAAAMSFHGGGLASDDPGSPHRLADRIRAAVYVAGAENDKSFTPEAAETLDEALTAAGVEHTIEFYPAAHGFAVSDHSAAYDPDAAERHWKAMESFFGDELG